MLHVKPIDHGYERLNRLNAFDKDFSPGICEGAPGCRSQPLWTSTDPRLVSSAHSGQRLALDGPPINGKVHLQDVPKDRPRYKGVYNSYSDIGGGQIRYYIDKELAVPFVPQLFVKPGLVRGEDYIDPMGSCKPHYYRASLDTKNCLNWIRDSQFHREDLMSKQLWNRNRTSYETKYMY